MSEISVTSVKLAGRVGSAGARETQPSAPVTGKDANDREVSRPKQEAQARDEPVDISSPRLAEALAEFQRSIDRDLQIRVDDVSGRTVVTVIDPGTEEVIRQIPAEEVLRSSEALAAARSLLFDAEI